MARVLEGGEDEPLDELEGTRGANILEEGAAGKSFWQFGANSSRLRFGIPRHSAQKGREGGCALIASQGHGVAGRYFPSLALDYRVRSYCTIVPDIPPVGHFWGGACLSPVAQRRAPWFLQGR